MVRKADPTAKHYLTVKEWAEVKGKNLDKPQSIRLGMIVKGKYKELYNTDPKMAYRKQPNTGRTIYVGAGYDVSDLPLIEAGLELIETEQEKKQRLMEEESEAT